MRHTPGPWEVTYSTNFPDQQTVQAEGSDRILALIDRADEQDYANARLIAAAPELLSALKAACQDIRLAAEIHKAKGLEAASHELRAHEQIYQNVIRLAEGQVTR